MDQELQVRCRNCPGCLRARRHLWRLRAEWETMHHRTWFFTGTWAQQTDDLDVFNDECTKYLKRLRKRLAPKDVTCRYLLVPEKHKSGKLHMHALVHESRKNADAGQLSYRDMTEPWQKGYYVAKLCDWRTAGYVTKYATKKVGETTLGQRPRIRASRGYGAAVMERDADALAEILKDRPPIERQELWTMNLRQILKEIRCEEAKEANPLSKLL